MTEVTLTSHHLPALEIHVKSRCEVIYGEMTAGYAVNWSWFPGEGRWADAGMLGCKVSTHHLFGKFRRKLIKVVSVCLVPTASNLIIKNLGTRYTGIVAIAAVEVAIGPGSPDGLEPNLFHIVIFSLERRTESKSVEIDYQANQYL